MNNIFLSVIIPCYNEEKNLQAGKIEKVITFLKKKSYLWELLIVDDGSIDNSRQLIRKIIKNNQKIRLIENPHQGKANTVITGMLNGLGKYLLFTDFDQATPIAEIDKFIPFFEEDYDIVIGSRKDERKGAPFVRAIMGPGFTMLRKLILGLPNISDTQCGFKAFRNSVAKDIFKRLKLYKDMVKAQGSQVTAGFDVELLYLADKLGYKIREVAVTWHYVDTRRVNPLKDSFSALLDLLKIKLNNINGLYVSGT